MWWAHSAASTRCWKPLAARFSPTSIKSSAPPPSLLHQVSLFTLPHYHTPIFLPPIIPCAVKQLSNHFLKSVHYRSSPLTVTQNHYQIFNATQATNKQTNNARKPQEKLIIPPKTSRLWAPLTSQGKVT